MILVPVMVQIVLTMVVYVLLNVAKARALRRGEVDLARRGQHDDAWPDSVNKINNNILNQFEVPVLLYVLSFACCLDAVTLRQSWRRGCLHERILTRACTSAESCADAAQGSLRLRDADALAFMTTVAWSASWRRRRPRISPASNGAEWRQRTIFTGSYHAGIRQRPTLAQSSCEDA
jgi:hypothetical protein